MLSQGRRASQEQTPVRELRAVLTRDDVMCLLLLCRAKHPVKVHVWAGISMRGRTGICVFEGMQRLLQK